MDLSVAAATFACSFHARSAARNVCKCYLSPRRDNVVWAKAATLSTHTCARARAREIISGRAGLRAADDAEIRQPILELADCLRALRLPCRASLAWECCWRQPASAPQGISPLRVWCYLLLSCVRQFKLLCTTTEPAFDWRLLLSQKGLQARCRFLTGSVEKLAS